MITEDYVSFETAKLLKEKGFDKYPIFPCYKDDGSKLFIDIPTTLDTINYHFIPAPTLQMAMKWLRVVHRLDMDISIEYTTEKVKVYYYSILKKTAIRDIDCLHSETNFNSYEEACGAAIRYCLENLI